MVGIYIWENLINGKVYVGQSKNIPRRYGTHLNRLRANKHANSHLQKAWNSYGEKFFNFRVIEECNTDQLNDLEFFWMSFYNSLDSNLGYNICKLPYSHKGVKRSLETKIKIGFQSKTRWTNEDYRNNQISKRVGITQSAETVKRKIDSMSREYLVTFPDGNIITIKNLKNFCKLYKLDDSSMIKVSKGKIKQHKGFICKKV